MKTSRLPYMVIVLGAGIALLWLLARPVSMHAYSFWPARKNFFRSFMHGNAQMRGSCPMSGMHQGMRTNQGGSRNWQVPESAHTWKNPFQGDEAIREGKVLFEQNCASCHGKTGRGNGMAAMALNPPPSDLTRDTVQSQDDGVLFWKIKHGNPPMPGFGGMLEDDKIWKIVLYVRTLREHREKTSHPSQKLGG